MFICRKDLLILEEPCHYIVNNYITQNFIFTITISQCTVDVMVRSTRDLFDILIYVDITPTKQGLVHGEIFSQRGRPSRKFLAHEQIAYSTAETRSTDDGILTLLYNTFFV